MQDNVVSPTKRIILEPITTVILPEWKGLLEPEGFFTDRKKIHLLNNFADLILPGLESVDEVPESRLTVSRLRSAANDLEIQRDLPGNRFSKWYHAALLIAQQANGERGPLLTNEGANIFFLLIGDVEFAISVRRYLSDGVWDIAEWLADERDVWEIGGQIITLDSEAEAV